MAYSCIDFNHTTILITGGAGFIGSNLAFYFQENYPNAKVVLFDCFRNNTVFSNGHPQSLGHYKNLIGFNGEVICGDLKNETDMGLLNRYKFDYIFHHAAISDTRVYEQEIIMRTNVNSFYDLLAIVRTHKATLVYASSAAVYGNMPAPQTVGNENPDSPYAFSKYIMDKIAYDFSDRNPDIRIVGLRFFNVYGPREYYKGKTASMIIQLGHQILSNNPPNLFQGSDKILRDFINIEDVLQANIKACDTKRSGVYNVGTGKAISFQKIADTLQKCFNTNIPTNYFSNPYSSYQMHTQADISSTYKYLDFDPRISLEEGITNYIPEIKKSYNTPVH